MAGAGGFGPDPAAHGVHLPHHLQQLQLQQQQQQQQQQSGALSARSRGSAGFDAGGDSATHWFQPQGLRQGSLTSEGPAAGPPYSRRGSPPPPPHSRVGEAFTHRDSSPLRAASPSRFMPIG
jgi:hypothetical protein